MRRSFFEYLRELDLKPSKFETYAVRNEEKIFFYLNDIIKNNRKVLVYGDPDPDGLMSILQFKTLFRSVGFSNYTMYKYQSRNHTLDELAVIQAVQESFEYIIICDTASSELTHLTTLHNFGVKAIVIDHHICDLFYHNYPESTAICNSILENRINFNKHVEPLTMSAGALVYFILYRFCMEYKLYCYKVDLESLACLALVSLYSDCIEMSSPLNRAIYEMATSCEMYRIPAYIRFFLSEHNLFRRRYIEFNFAPKINAAFRGERFDLINEFLNNEEDYLHLTRVASLFTELHRQSADMVAKVSDLIEYQELENFTIANLNSVNKYLPVEELKLYNYTGLIANTLNKLYGKPTVVLCNCEGYVKGSFRDSLGRDYLPRFKTFSDSNGHGAAFGIRMDKLEELDFRKSLAILDKKFSYGDSVETLVFDYLNPRPDIELFQAMASYNEFSNPTMPPALLKMKYTGGMSEYKNEFSYSYRWEKITIKSQFKLNPFVDILIRPTITSKLMLYVEN